MTKTQKILLIAGGSVAMVLVVILIGVGVYVAANKKTNASNESRVDGLKRDAIYKRILAAELVEVEKSPIYLDDAQKRGIWLEERRRSKLEMLHRVYDEKPIDELILVAKYQYGYRLPD